MYRSPGLCSVVILDDHLVPSCYKPYMERLSELQLNSLKIRKIEADLILFYKSINHLADIDCSNSIRFSHSFMAY